MGSKVYWMSISIIIGIILPSDLDLKKSIEMIELFCSPFSFLRSSTR